MAVPMRPDELARYSDAIVRVALRLRKGDRALAIVKASDVIVGKE